MSIQAQIINLLEELQEKLGLTYLFIAHDLAVVRHISDRVAVMYVGKIVEVTDRNEIFEDPLHPYTRALLSAIPIPDPVLEKRRTRMILVGDVPSPVNPPSGCRFNPRCPYAEDNCRTDEPLLAEVRPGSLRRLPLLGRGRGRHEADHQQHRDRPRGRPAGDPRARQSTPLSQLGAAAPRQCV